MGDVKNTKMKNLKPFSFSNCEYIKINRRVIFKYQINDKISDENLIVQDQGPDGISDSEIETVRKVIQHLDLYRTKLPLTETPCSDDDLCTICYAYPISAYFKPCNHSTCRACIDRHLLNSRNCFFCKAMINQVVTTEGKVLHEFSSDSSINDSMDSDA